ncbi:AfsR/SARP family transcriptional regulator [Streptomyces misionensis]|uniref:AfsR/SARP family transcriptional regulator n=1 Tax=Streptomyces misionensis TaxID=67331 RepID=A0A5C6JVM6_9ACTN|nr:BTAD domain-containing putative transcriptional regulator [Streptomyces misionensis]TWV44844.1 AfsR/SARP family transcriptional regulator [Streptomyces misionensis]
MTTELALLSRVAFRGREITAPRLRGLLALLAEELRAGCSTGRLAAGLWPDEQPERPGKAVQVLVSRLRTQLGADVVVSTPAGYRLALDETQVDSSALLAHEAASAACARAGDHAGALARSEAGLALWDGTVGDADADDPVTALRAARVRPYRALVRHRALALAHLGRPAEALPPLAELHRELPRDEELLARLLSCEAATAGRAAALLRYEEYRRGLREELGADPGPELRALHAELLRPDTAPARHGVPHEPNPLLGREADVAAVTRLLRDARVVTLLGPGGLGKTRLSHAVSRAAEHPVVHFVPLAGVTADEDVAAEVASAVGAGEARQHTGPADGDVVRAVAAALGPGPALLVLDNCEHVLAGAAALARALVSRCRELRVLTTSRAPLGLTSEAVYAVPELSLATSVELFEQRARAARPGVELPADRVAEICRHLDGLPLAVELAAARVRVLSVADISHRLRDRFALLRGGARDAPERHRTLRAVVEWSWNLLEPDGRAALRALSVFPGGFTEESAQYVLGEDGDALGLLEQLAAQSLIKVGEGPFGVRFHMLETLREFSAARRAEAGEEEAVTDRFLAWARDFGRAHHDVLFGADAPSSFHRARAEQDNLVLALRHALARSDGPATAALTAVLAAVWSAGNSYTRLTALVAETAGPLSHFRPEHPEDVETARSAAVVCTTCLFMGYGPHAGRHLVTLRRLPPAPPDTALRALAVVLGAVPEIRPPGYERLARLCEAPEPMLAGIASGVASYVWEAEQQTERALDCARRMQAALGPGANPSLLLLCHGRISELCLKLERGAEAYDHLRAAEALGGYGDWSDLIGVRYGLVSACLQRGEIEEAEYWLDLATGDQQPESASPELLSARAEVALARGLSEVGLGLWRQATARMREGALEAGDPFADAWSLQMQSAALAAHAQHGRLEPVAGLAERLRGRLLAMLTGTTGAGDLVELPVYGTVLVALGFTGLARGETSAVRLMALAERMPVLRDYPTLSSARCRQAAENAAGAAYAEARSAYAALGPEELRAEALRELTAAARG